MEKQREIDAKKKEIKPDIMGASEKISKVVGEKAFMMSRQKEIDMKRAEIKPDMKGISDKISQSVGEKVFRIEKQKELTKEFEVLGFLAPFVMVRERSTGRKGSLLFQHWPRFYFDFNPH